MPTPHRPDDPEDLADLIALHQALEQPAREHSLKGPADLSLPEFLAGQRRGWTAEERERLDRSKYAVRLQKLAWRVEGPSLDVLRRWKAGELHGFEAMAMKEHLAEPEGEESQTLLASLTPPCGGTLIPRDCKRLAEVDFPIAVVSAHAAREKSIRHGHPSTLHLWWARRPLAACRSMLLALLLPDPCDPLCPPEFRTKARELLRRIPGVVSLGPSDAELRGGLLGFIGDFANWDNSSHPVYLETARGLVRAAHPEETPLVVDPFAGGGSIPLEALRLGCDAFASDLNPVACLILKVLLEDIPRHGPELAEELRRVGGEIKKAAEKELAEFYPADPDGARPIAYLWARTVRCETPGCGAEIPLVRSLWLGKKENRRRALRPKVVRAPGQPPRVEFEIFQPANEDEVESGTVSRAKATCLCCNVVLPAERVRAQLREQRGGADVVFDEAGKRVGGARLLAIVTLREDGEGRHYRPPTDRDYLAIWKAVGRLAAIAAGQNATGWSAIPDEPLPPQGTLGFRVQRYGMLQWGTLFTARQKVALVSTKSIAARLLASRTRSGQLAAEVAEALQMTFSRWLSYVNAQCMWVSAAKMEAISNIFARHALPFIWDFGEINPFADVSGAFDSALEWVALVCEASKLRTTGQVQLADACASPLSDEACSVWFTDPPYYDAIPYSDLSDFFFVWQKRALPGHAFSADPFDPNNPLSPKDREAVQDEARKYQGEAKDRGFFERTMAKAFTEGRRILRDDGIGSVVFAHKTTEGWEALLSGLISGRWTIVASWPVATERPGRLRSHDSAALATSVHLVCRPCPADAPVGDWGEVLRELPHRVGDWMMRLQGEGVHGADLVFACIGPALEIFSRYRRVETPEGKEIPLGGDPEASDPDKRGFLAYVWEAVGRAALEQVLGSGEARAREGDAGVLEEDARLTALFLWTLQATEGEKVPAQPLFEEEEAEEPEEDEEESKPRRKPKGFSLVFDVARRFAQPLGIHLDDWEGRVIETKKGVVRLLPVRERAEQLFGKDGPAGIGDRLDRPHPEGTVQGLLFDVPPEIKGRKGGRKKATAAAVTPRAQQGATTLDRVHAAMLLLDAGKTQALRSLLASEVERGPGFLRLANALSALYPADSDEKRLIDAMLLAARR